MRYPSLHSGGRERERREVSRPPKGRSANGLAIAPRASSATGPMTRRKRRGALDTPEVRGADSRRGKHVCLEHAAHVGEPLLASCNDSCTPQGRSSPTCAAALAQASSSAAPRKLLKAQICKHTKIAKLLRRVSSHLAQFDPLARQFAKRMRRLDAVGNARARFRPRPMTSVALRTLATKRLVRETVVKATQTGRSQSARRHRGRANMTMRGKALDASARVGLGSTLALPRLRFRSARDQERKLTAHSGQGAA